VTCPVVCDALFSDAMFCDVMVCDGMGSARLWPEAS